MLRGLYSAAAGMITQQRKHDTATNNISNVNTPGFKGSNMISRAFPEMLISIVNGGGASSKFIGRLNSGVLSEENIPNFMQGDLQMTDNPTDFALISNLQTNPPSVFDVSGKLVTEDGVTVYRPQAFFALSGEDGEERFTRNGKFTVDSEGTLVNGSGLKVLGVDGNPILPPLPMSEIKITNTGQFLNANNGQPVLDRNNNPIALRISRVENPNKLVSEGNGTFRLEDPESTATAINFSNIEDLNNEGVQVHQGFIEQSNVNTAQATIDIMSALRAYESNQKVVQYYDRSMDKAVNEVGRI
ncbi:MAG TPA: flagellar hook-basal body protein [Bacilli bacterium]